MFETEMEEHLRETEETRMDEKGLKPITHTHKSLKRRFVGTDEETAAFRRHYTELLVSMPNMNKKSLVDFARVETMVEINAAIEVDRRYWESLI